MSKAMREERREERPMKPKLDLELDPDLPDGEMLCFAVDGSLLARQPSQDRPPPDCTRVAMSPGDYRRMLEQLGLRPTEGQTVPPALN